MPDPPPPTLVKIGALSLAGTTFIEQAVNTRFALRRSRCTTQIQRIYRGHIGRRAAKRRRTWESAGPGPERLKLGVRMIEDTKVCFARNDNCC